MISFRRALFASALPYKRHIYSKTKWSFLTETDESIFRKNLRYFYSDAVIEKSLKRCDAYLTDHRDDIYFVCIHDSEYPRLLKQIYDPPPVLFFTGKTFPIGPYLSVVGTRNPAMITKAAIKILAEDIYKKDSNTVVVSGFARGVDYFSHCASVENGLKTAAVLGSGILNPSPASSRPLLDEAQKKGNPVTLISEFFPDENAARHHFPRRNRIIAGISERLILMQAPKKSGAMITARYALDEGRDVAVFYNDLLSGEGFHEGGIDLIDQGAETLTMDMEKRILSNTNNDVNIDLFWELRTKERLQRVGENIYYIQEEKNK